MTTPSGSPLPGDPGDSTRTSRSPAVSPCDRHAASARVRIRQCTVRVASRNRAGTGGHDGGTLHLEFPVLVAVRAEPVPGVSRAFGFGCRDVKARRARRAGTRAATYLHDEPAGVRAYFGPFSPAVVALISLVAAGGRRVRQGASALSVRVEVAFRHPDRVRPVLAGCRLFRADRAGLGRAARWCGESRSRAARRRRGRRGTRRRRRRRRRSGRAR